MFNLIMALIWVMEDTHAEGEGLLGSCLIHFICAWLSDSAEKNNYISAIYNMITFMCFMLIVTTFSKNLPWTIF